LASKSDHLTTVSTKNCFIKSYFRKGTKVFQNSRRRMDISKLHQGSERKRGRSNQSRMCVKKHSQNGNSLFSLIVWYKQRSCLVEAELRLHRHPRKILRE